MANKGKKLWEDYKRGIGYSADSPDQKKSSRKSSSMEPAVKSRGREEWEKFKAGGGLDFGFDGSAIDNFLRDSQSYLERASRGLQDMDWAKSRSEHTQKDWARDADNMQRQYREVEDLVRDNAEWIEPESLRKIQDYLDRFGKGLSEVKEGYRKNRDFYGQFPSEEAYGEYVDWENKRTLDVDAYAREIAELEKTADTMDYDWTDANQRKKAEEEIKKIQDEVIRRKVYLNQAKTIQEKERLSSVANPDSDSYDPEFQKRSEYRSTKTDNPWEKFVSQYGMGYGDLEYEYINQKGLRTAINQNHILKKQEYEAEESPFQEKGYDYLTDREIGIYNYYYSQGGKEMAKKYLDSLQEELNYRKAAALYANMEGKTGQEMLYGVGAGFDQFQSGMKGFVSGLLGDESYTPPTATQFASGMVRQDLEDTGWKLPKALGGASLGQVGYDAITTTTNMVPSILGATLANAVAPGSGAFVGNALMGASAAGNAYTEAIQQGHSKDQARAYAAAMGGSEVAMQYALGGISKLGGIVSNHAISKALAGVENGVRKAALELGGSMASEALEEGVQEVLTPVFQNLFLHADADVDWSEVAYSAILGGLTAGVLEGPSVVGNAMADSGHPAEPVQAQQPRQDGGMSTAEKLETPQAAPTVTAPQDTSQQELAKEESPAAGGDIQKVAAKFGKQAKAVEQIYRLGGAEQDVDSFERAFSLAHEMGRSGVSEDYTIHSPATQTLTEQQRRFAWQTGQAAQRQVGDTPVRAVDKSTGRPVEVAQVIEATEPGQLQLQLADGKTASIQDIQFQDEGEAALYDAVAELGVSANMANTLVDTWRKAPDGVSAEAYAAGMVEVFAYGQHHIPKGEMAKDSVASGLTKAQREVIYAQGAAFGKEAVQQQENHAQRARMAHGTETAKQRTETMAASYRETTDGETGRKGRVVFDRKGRTLTDVQEAGIKTMELLSEVVGAEFHVFESYEKEGKRLYRDENGVERAAPNGWYEPNTGRIYVDLNAGDTGAGTMLFTVAHELTHFIRQWSPAKFDALAEAVIKLVYEEKGISVVKLVRSQQAKAERNGRTIDFDTAYEEVVADSMESILTSGRVAEMMAQIQQEDQTLWQKIRQWFQKLAQDIRQAVQAYAGYKPDSAEGRAVAQMEQLLPILEGFYQDALQEAGENYRAAEGQKNTTEDGGVKMLSIRNTSRMTLEEQLKKYYKGELKTSDSLYFGETPDSVLQSGLEPLPLAFPTANFKKSTQDKHNVPRRAIKGLRSSLEKALFSFVKDGRFGFVVPDIDADGKPLLIGIETNVEMDRQKVNVIRSVYGLDNPKAWIQNQIQAGKEIAVYDKKRADSWLQTYGYLASVGDGIELFELSVSQHESNVNKEIEPSSPEGSQLSVRSRVPNSSIPDSSIDNSLENVNKKLSARQEKVDADGNALSAEQAAFFQESKVRDEDGKLRVMYHGTPSGDFTVFRDGSYFTSDKAYADGYQNPNASMLRPNKPISSPKTFAVYLNIKKPFDLRDPETKRIYIEEYIKGGNAVGINPYLPDGEYQKIQTVDWTEGEDLRDFLQDNEYDYDGLILDEGGTGGYGDSVKSRGMSYVVFSPEQIKNVDNTKPTENPDIRYSDRDPLQKKTLEELEKENSALREDMKQLKEWNKLQKQVTGGKMLTPRSVEAAARYLKKLFYAGGDAKELAQKLSGVYEYILNDPESTWEGVREAAEPAIRWLQSNEKTRKSQYAQDVLATLKGRNFRLDEVQLGEVRYQYGSLKEYRRAVKNMASSKAGMSLDELWQEMASQYPDIFDAEVNAADMPEAFAQVLERLESMENSESAMEQRVKDQAMLREIYDSYWRVTVLETTADKHKKELDALRDKHTVKMAELRQKRDAALEELREEKKASVEGVRDTRNKADMRKKIRRKIMELQKLLLRGNKKQNVKEGMQDFAATALASAEILFMDNYSNEDMVRNGVGVEVDAAESRLIDETQKLLNMRKDLYNEGLIRQEAEEVMVYGKSGSYEKRMEKSAKLDKMISENMRKLKGVFERERNRLNKATVAGILGELASSYRKLASSDMVYIRGAFDENVYQHLNQLQENMGGATVRDMSLRQLKELADAYTMVLSTVRNANRLFNEKLNMSRDEAAGKVIREIRSSGKQHSKARLPGKQSAETFSWNNEKPVYAFERLGSETMMAQYQAIRDGQDTYAEDMQAAKAYRQEQEETYHRKDWDMDKLYAFQLESGNVQLNVEQMMSIYALSRRKEGLAHLLGGGFVFGKDAKRIISKAGVPMTYLVEDATAYRLTVEEINQIANTLTKEQRAFADAMQKYLADVMGSKGNEVSMALYGVKSFNDEHYFPIRSSGQYMERAKLQAMQKSQGQINLVNSGFTKSTVPNAKNPVALDGFLDVWADHVQEMSMYHGLALPLEDFRRVYNYAPTVQEGQMAVSVNAVIENAYGRAATGYLDQLYKDLNADVLVDNRETIGKKMVGKFKAAAVMASASVVIQQFSALPRAFALIDPKYFIGRKLDKKKHDQLWAELKKYAPVAFIKEMGYFDTGVGMSGKQYLLQQEYGSIREKLAGLVQDENYRDEVLGKLPALADEMTWCGIWEAVKRETLERNPKMDVRSEPFLKLAGKRFSEIIDKTQVYDSVLSRSANMRSKAWYMNVITSFMAEPTTTINMVEDVIRKGDKKLIARTLGSVLLSQTMNALLVSMVYAARDDDEDKTWLEKYLSTVTVEMLEGFNPLGYYPLLKDVWSLMQGYDVERPDMTLVSEMVKAANRLTDAQEKLSKAETEEERAEAQKTLQNAMWSIADAVASLLGLPLKNIRRDVKGAVSLARTVWADVNQRDTTALSLQDEIWNDVMQSIPFFGSRYYKDRRDKLYGAMAADDREYTRRLEKTYASESTFHGAVRTALREHDSRIWEAAVVWNEGKLEEYLKIAKEILGESHFEQDDIVLAIRAEAESMLEKKAPGEEKAIGIFNAEKLGVALAQDNGEMVKIICQDLIDTDMANGKTEDEAKDALESDVRRELKRRYLEGDLNRNLTVRQLARHGGMTQEEASAKVEGWDWFKANPGSDATEADVTGYLKTLPDLGRSMKDYGLSMDTYRKKKKVIGAFEADKDEKGESIPYSKINKAFPYIRDLPLSAEQKTALAVACGWSLKTVEKNKLW